jgi:twitching motility protein PilT
MSTSAPAASAASATSAQQAPPAVPTNQILATMLKAGNVSDLIFSPGRPPQVELSSKLVPVDIPGVGVLSTAYTAKIAGDLIGGNKIAVDKLKEEGSCDVSYSLERFSRFRVNIFRQRGSYAVVMRVIPSVIPDFKTFNLPKELENIPTLKNGLVLVTGPTGSGKSSTLAAIINMINEAQPVHIVTIEDPIEFLHPHKKATIHQRELHSDTPNFALALRAALRQAPKVILVGEMRDRETIEIAMEAAETGHLVFSTLHTMDAAKTVERILSVFPLSEQHAVRNRLGKTFRYIISQRLLPKADGKGRVGLIEILKSTLRTREYVERGEGEGKTLLDAMRDGTTEGMQYFDGEIERLIREGGITIEAGLTYATNAGNLRLQISDLVEAQEKAQEQQAAAGAAKDGEFEIER